MIREFRDQLIMEKVEEIKNSIEGLVYHYKINFGYGVKSLRMIDQDLQNHFIGIKNKVEFYDLEVRYRLSQVPYLQINVILHEGDEPVEFRLYENDANCIVMTK